MTEKTGSSTTDIVDIALDERTVARRSAEVERERNVAIFDLLEENHFVLLNGNEGPYRLKMAIRESRLIVDVHAAEGALLEQISVQLSAFRTLVRDYFMVCENYFKALKHAMPSHIETLDTGRRGLHDEGSEMLRDSLSGKVELDLNTARRLFTLLCVLHFRG